MIYKISQLLHLPPLLHFLMQLYSSVLGVRYIGALSGRLACSAALFPYIAFPLYAVSTFVPSSFSHSESLRKSWVT